MAPGYEYICKLTLSPALTSITMWKTYTVFLIPSIFFQLHPYVAMQWAVLIVMESLYLCSAVKLKVGIYNEIPDLGNDGLTSYKHMIEKGFNDMCHMHTVDAVVDKALYSPYANLNDYLSEDGFDLIEMDAADLRQVVEQDLVAQVANLPHDIVPAAIKAVTIDRKLYAYPTLICGNFLVGLTPGNEENCPLRYARLNYAQLRDTMESCKANLSIHGWERMLGGRMDDRSGWHLPFLYIDGYIDVYGRESAELAIDEVTNGIVDHELCERLSWYVSCCNDKNGENKCYNDFPGSYVQSSDNVYSDIEGEKTLFFLGVSELLAQIERQSDRKPYAIISGPLGMSNNLLLFTDALVVNKARWNTADAEKRMAIKAFVKYFLSNTLRTNIAMGVDLDPPQVRYLLQATKTFYENTEDKLYQDVLWHLTTAVAAPPLTKEQLEIMKDVLRDLCIIIPQGKNSSNLYPFSEFNY